MPPFLCWDVLYYWGPFVICHWGFGQIVSFSNVKEDVYGGLDAWCAWELEFPLVAVKKALRLLQGEQQWRRIIQVSHSFVWCEDIDWFGETPKLFHCSVCVYFNNQPS